MRVGVSVRLSGLVFSHARDAVARGSGMLDQHARVTTIENGSLTSFSDMTTEVFQLLEARKNSCVRPNINFVVNLVAILYKIV